MFGQEMVIKFV